MNCPICRHESIVLRSDGHERRRRCTNAKCNNRFTTVEVLKDDHERQKAAVQTVVEVAEKIKDAA